MECCVQRLFATATYKHESWSASFKHGHDIAVLELESPLDLALPAFPKRDVTFISGQKMTAIGWGETESTDAPRYLQMADDLAYLSPRECAEFFSDFSNDRMFCAGSLDQTQDTCSGQRKRIPLSHRKNERSF